MGSQWSGLATNCRFAFLLILRAGAVPAIFGFPVSLFMLTPAEETRYQRHLQLAEIGRAGQVRLRSGRVLVVGAGGLGCPVLQQLAAAGVGTLGLADDDRVALSNLPRQQLYATADVGELKVLAAGRRLQALNPLVQYDLHALKITRTNVRDLLAGYDIVVDATDNFPTRYLLNDACVSLGKPLVSGAIYKFEGQVSVFNYQQGPTYRCLFPVPPTAAEAPNCAETGVLSVLPSLIGTAQAAEVLKMLLGIGEVLRGRLWIFDALSFESRLLKFARRAETAVINLETADQENYAEICAPELDISVTELRDLIAQTAPLLLDVREPAEFAAGHLPDAVLWPLAEVLAQVQIPEDLKRQAEVVVYCQAGSRGSRAVAALSSAYANVNFRNLRGGFAEWIK